MMGAAAGVMVSAVTGAGLLWPPEWRGRRWDWAAVAGGAALALGLGLAIDSVTMFAALALGMGDVKSIMALDAAAAGLAWFVGWSLAERGGETVTREPATAARWCLVALGIAAVAAVGLALAAAAWRGMLTPHGLSDAYGIWNFRALYLYRDPDHWRNAFNPALINNADYPLLLPLTLARLWFYNGSESADVPRCLGLLFYGLLMMRMAGTLWRLRGAGAALLGLCALTALPLMTEAATDQYAEMPLAFFILTAISCAVEGVESRDGGWRVWVLAGLAAGAAAWTKNEGLLFVVCLGTGVVIGSWPGGRVMLARVGVMLAGGAVMLAAVLVFKGTVAGRNYLVQDQAAGGLMARVWDGARHAMIWRVLWRNLLSPPGHVVIWLLAGYAAVAGMGPGRGAAARICGVTLGMMCVGYYCVYVVTPLPLAWQLGTSLTRLAEQVWPAWVMAVMLAARGPGERAEPAVT